MLFNGFFDQPDPSNWTIVDASQSYDATRDAGGFTSSVTAGAANGEAHTAPRRSPASGSAKRDR